MIRALHIELFLSGDNLIRDMKSKSRWLILPITYSTHLMDQKVKFSPKPRPARLDITRTWNIISSINLCNVMLYLTTRHIIFRSQIRYPNPPINPYVIVFHDATLPQSTWHYGGSTVIILRGRMTRPLLRLGSTSHSSFVILELW